MIAQATPLYGVLTWSDDCVGDGVMQVVGWVPTGASTFAPVAVMLDGHNGPARTYRDHCDEARPWIDYFASYQEAADQISTCLAAGHGVRVPGDTMPAEKIKENA